MAKRFIAGYDRTTEWLVFDREVPPEKWNDLRACVTVADDDPEMVYIYNISREDAERVIGEALSPDLDYFAEAYA